MSDIQKYREALNRFCKGKERMCVPVQSDDDDMLLSRALDKLEKVQQEVQRLRLALEWVKKRFSEEWTLDGRRKMFDELVGDREGDFGNFDDFFEHYSLISLGGIDVRLI